MEMAKILQDIDVTLGRLHFSIPGTRTLMYALSWSKVLLSTKKLTRFWVSWVLGPSLKPPLHAHEDNNNKSTCCSEKRNVLIGRYRKMGTRHRQLHHHPPLSIASVAPRTNVRCMWDCEKRQVGGTREFV